MFGWFRRKKPPAAPVVESVVVRATGAAKASDNRVDMAEFMAAAGLQARAEGHTDPDIVRNRKIKARMALRAALEKATASGQPVELVIGSKTYVVPP